MSDTSKITLGQLKTALTQAKNYTDNEIASVTGVSKVEPEELDMPKVFFYGNALPTTKDNVNLTMDYISNTAKFSSFVKLKCQGTSSMSYAKKNFTLSMFEDADRSLKLKKDFKGWGKQSKFCLKANYVDTTHTRNLAGARIAYDMVNSRPDSPFKQQLLQCPRNGAVDGFPIKLYFNGEFYGIYTWNIPKDGWMFNMDKNNANHIVLCAERNTDGNASLSNSCQFKKLWTDGDGGDWSVEFGTYSTDLQTKFNRVIAFVKDSTDAEFKANISQYLDLYSVIDYYCFSYLCCHLDGLAKNMLMVTYDGNIWGCSLYDMDSIFGVHWNGQSYVASNYQCPEQYQEQFSLLWPKLERCFGRELYQRYLELRHGALSLSNIIKHVEEIYDIIPDRVFNDEHSKWTNLPCVTTNTMTRFRNYMRDRAVYVDAEMLAIGSNLPCTGIVLSADTLSFTITDTQTLSVVVSPDNCTDTVTWSVSPTGVVSVNNGVVTPLANGSCTITATCGNYSDTCNVTVSGMSESSVACTGITLNKTELALGASEGGATENVNLLSGINSTIDSSGNLVFDTVTLEAGAYEISNINGGTFTWLGYTINGTKNEPNRGTTNSVIFLIGETTDVIINAYPDNKETNTADKLALYKFIPSNPQQFTQAGTGYFDNSGNVVENADNVYSESISLDPTKKYAVEYNGSATLAFQYVVLKIDNTIAKNPTSTKTGQIIKIIENARTLAASVNTGFCGLSDIRLMELKIAEGTSSINNAQLTATVTPENCTQPVVWSVNPTGIVTVDNGLVTAVSNGEATVTATCGTQSATCNVTVSGIENDEPPTQRNAVFKVDSSCYNAETNTLTDSVSGLTATLTGTPTVSGNNIMFTANDSFIFDISSLGLTNSDITVIIKLTQMSTAASFKNILSIGSSNVQQCWNYSDTVYSVNNNYRFQYGKTVGSVNNKVTDYTIGNFSDSGGSNFSKVQANVEQEIVMSINKDTKDIRIFIDGELVQNGKVSYIHNPLYLGNHEGTNRFVGGYSLIEIYDAYCNDYTEFTNMINNASSGGDTDIYATAEYAITEPRTFNGTSDYIDTGIQLFDTAKDFAVYIDYTPTAGVVQPNNTTVFHAIHEISPHRGLTLMFSTTSNYFIGGSQGGTYLSNISTDNNKILIQFVNGVISTIKTIGEYGFVYNSVLATTAGDSPYVQVTENLLLGCYQDVNGNKDRYWNGTINKFAVWFRQLTDGEISQVFDMEYAAPVSTTYTNGYIARVSGHISDGTTLGAIKETALDISTDFISCTSNDIFVITAPSTTYGSGVVAYDSDKNYLSTYLGDGVWSTSADNNTGDIKLLKFKINNIPVNTGYIRLCFNTTDSTLVTIAKVHGSANN